MKAEVKVVNLELTHEDLVDIFSTATYGNSYMGIEVADDSEELLAKLKADENVDTECIEDQWAEVLLHGGSITVIDAESEAEDEEDAKKWAYKGSGHRVSYIECFDSWGGKYGATGYDMNLEEFLAGCSSSDAYHLLEEILDGDGDMYTGWNLMQYVTFGELIYG